MSSQSFRAGVVIVIRRDDGRLLAFERKHPRGAWQLPQGGIDAGEEPIDAAWREMQEETGLDHSHVRLVDQLPDWIAYEWPEDIRGDDPVRGQIQRWFLFGVIPDPTSHDHGHDHDGGHGHGHAHSHADDVTPRPDDREFVSWTWMTPRELVDCVIDWRRPAYQRAFARLLP
jgi:putative (di)nucleoside polyphosphate hydrolase